jgi:leader peptidase (prepilin peptidase)/N-methyltransferase
MARGSIPLLLAAAAAGLVIGPWLGIAVDRVVERVPFRPEHRCTRCATGLGPRSLIPVSSWLDRCPSCAGHKGLRYPAVDLASAATFTALAWRFGLDWRLGPYLALGAVLVVLSAIDLETHLLPNVVVWPSIGAGLFGVLVLSGELAGGEGITGALLGAAVFGGFIGLAHLIYEPGMGRGDVKLGVLLGLFVGWVAPSGLDAVRLALYALLLSLLGGSVVGLTINAVRRRGRAEFPLGPALAAGAVAMVVASTTVVGP